MSRQRSRQVQPRHPRFGVVVRWVSVKRKCVTAVLTQLLDQAFTN